MATVTVTILTTPTELPAGITAGVMRVALLRDGVEIDSTDATDNTATFTDVAEGFYTATAVRLDDAGNELSGVVSTDFDVTGTTSETYDAPASLSVSVTP
mgnify:CR=1 FL=1